MHARLSKFIIVITLIVSFLAPTQLTLGQSSKIPKPTDASVDELKNKISDHNQRIAELEKEIAGYKKDLEDTTKQKSSLQATVRALELARKKLASEVSLASSKIVVVNNAIDTLENTIESKEEIVYKLKLATSNNLRFLNQNQDTTLIELALSENTLSSFLDKAENVVTVQKNISALSNKLQNEKKELLEDKTDRELKKKELLGYKEELTDKQRVVEITKAEQNSLLAKTKNKESEFQKTLAKKVALKNAFEQELLEFESALKYKIDPSLLPKTGTSPLRWPLQSIRITQLFGFTEFAKSQRVYNGKGHNGVDFAAQIGTPVLAAADGVVVASGNTDLVCPGASYGKWILIKHNNGLSTLSAHLSLIKATAGQTVSKGETIAYSGSTGYVTGPHLHFTVYASEAVSVQTLKSRSCRGSYTIPVSSFGAYLDPILYLPTL